MKPNWSEEGFERIKEAALRGNETLRQRRLEEYYFDPKLCISCSKIIPYEKRENKYCNHSCSAQITNLDRHKRALKECPCCKKKFVGKERKYCSRECDKLDKYNIFIEKWLRETAGLDTRNPSPAIKRYLREEQKNTCLVCKLDTWLGQPIGLILDHISGDPSDHRRENLRLICGNCDMQTPTYKSKNKGNGRAYRRQRYAEGKSY